MVQKTQRKNRNSNNGSQGAGFDISMLVTILVRNWYWFVISVVVAMAVGYLYMERKQPLFQRSSVLLIKNGKKSSDLSSFLEMNDMGSNNLSGSIEDELYIIRSLQILEQVVNRLNLDVAYSYEGRFRDFPVYKESPIKVDFLDNYRGYTSFKVVPLNAKNYSLSELKVNGVEIPSDFSAVAFDDTIKTPAGRIVVHPVKANLEYNFNKVVKVGRTSVSGAAVALQGAIQTTMMKKGGSLVKITCTHNNVTLVDAILNCLADEYTKALWDDKKRIIESTAEFIDERIKVIGEELGNVEKKLTDFKQKNQIVSVESSADTYLSESSSARAEVNQIRSQISVAQYIKNYVQDRTKSNELIPNVSGVGDAGVQSQIAEYNELMLKRNRLSLNSSENSPVVVKMNTLLEAMRTTITGSLDNYLNTLNLQLNSSVSVQRQANSRIAAIPMQESFTLNVERQQDIKSGLYTFLLNKREETAMQLAATETDIRVIEKPFGSTGAISPNKKSITMMFLLVGLGLPFAVIFIGRILDPSIHNKKELRALTSIPSVGVIPALKHKKDTSEDIVVGNEEANKVLEALHILKSNLSYMGVEGDRKQVLLFTSAHPRAGKSYVSINYAASIASTNEKVIWIDMDIRKRHTINFVEGKKGIRTCGLTTFLAGSHDIDDIIYRSVYNEYLDVIPAGPIPPNPVQLLLSHRLDELIEKLRSRYQYIIIDNVPMDVVADASIVNRVTDISVYVVRAGMTNRRYILDLNEQYEDNIYKNLCLVLNGVSLKQLGYGYGYGYGYGNEKRHKRKK